MPRPSPAQAILLLTGLIIATATGAQGIPGLPVVIDDGRMAKPAPPPPQQPKGELLDRVAAIVGDDIVTERELENSIADYIKNYGKDESQKGKKPPPADKLRAPILDRLVTRELLLQRAKRGKITVDDEDLLTAMREMAKDNGLTLDQLPDAMKAQGLNYDEQREDIRKQILIARLQQKEVIRHINITPRELDQYVERQRKMPGANDDYDFSDILIGLPPEATKAQVDEQEKKAQKVYEQAATEDFARLAITNSDAQTALQGGALRRKGGDLPTDLAEAIVALKPGEISKPFLTPNGFHILKLNSVQRAAGNPMQDQVHVRHILLKVDDLQDDATVRLKLANVRQRILNGEDFAVFASAMSQDAGSAVDGGKLDWVSPDEFDGAFANVVKGLKDNEISEPFQSTYGWHIVQLLGRRNFDTTEDSLRQRAMLQLRDNKAVDEIELWLRQMRDESYIELLDSKT